MCEDTIKSISKCQRKLYYHINPIVTLFRGIV